MLVDGYNIIFAWDSLKELAKIDLAAARGKLADILCNYQGYKQCELILVFDAYKVEGNPGEIMKYHNIHGRLHEGGGNRGSLYREDCAKNRKGA